MQRVNEFVFYDLATRVRSLVTMQVAEKNYNEIVWAWSEARDAVDAFYAARPLHFSAGSAISLFRLLESAVPSDVDQMIAKIAPNAESSEKIPWYTVNQICEAAKAFETALRTECAVMDAYYVVKKGVYSTKDLVENAHHQIPESIRYRIPQNTRDDFDQAGKCIAFDLPTAAAFHLLRGTESVVREYYELVVPGHKKASPKMRNWGVYTRLMRDFGGKQEIIFVLDHLRISYRNPVLHPEDFYSEERILVLFGLCVSAINLIQEEIDRVNQQSPASSMAATV